MELLRAYTLKELADMVSGEFVGDAELKTRGINELHVLNEGDIAFVDHPKYYDKTLNSKAGIILINKAVDCPEGKGLIVMDDPFKAFNWLTTYFLKEREDTVNQEPKIDPTAIVSSAAHIGNYVTIGANAVIHPGVVIYDHCVIGSGVEIHANTVVGSDAFYFKRREGYHDKMKSKGRVVIESDVEIGAACTIDRGITSDTLIGEGTKMDNQVHIGHDTIIGKRCLFAAHVGIAGCVSIGNDVILWGQVGCAANLSIGDGAVVYAQSGVSKSLDGKGSYFGSPAIDARLKMRELATISNLTRKK